MKKEENQKTKQSKDSIKIDDLFTRSHSPKAYLGCNTCKLKNTGLKKSVNKFNDYVNLQEKHKLKKTILEKNGDPVSRKPKVKLTDLCDEDKKRIVELIEELSKFVEKNHKLKETLDYVQKTKQEQQDYIIRQANLHLEEKSLYASEINEYKNKIDEFEIEMKNKISHWESHEKFMDTELAYLAKALEKSLKEKNELNEQLNHLKVCLRQSLESFQRLRAEVKSLECQEKRLNKFKSIACQTEAKFNLAEKVNASDKVTDEEFLSTSTQDALSTKSSLDIINDTLEHVYHLLKRKGEILKKPSVQNSNLYTSLKDKETSNENKLEVENNQPGLNLLETEEYNNYTKENGYKFLKPFDQCSKTSIQAERILKKIGKPLNLIPNNFLENIYYIKSHNSGFKKSSRHFELLTTNVFPKETVHINNLFTTFDDNRNHEDQLLEELFYTDKNFKELESIHRLEGTTEI